MNTREHWLIEATKLISDGIFRPKGLIVPNVRVSIGFTGSRTAKAIGAHWAPASAKDGIGQIYIVPTHDTSIAILDTLVHELVHAAIGNDKGHGPVFKRAALSVGLEGKMRSTHAGKELRERLNALVKDIGEIPHAQLNKLEQKKKQGTRLIKVSCLSTEYTCRITKKWIDDFGTPICPCCNVEMREEIK